VERERVGVNIIIIIIIPGFLFKLSPLYLAHHRQFPKPDFALAG
jgi:hypothetical protein